jgi:RNA polymerase sigma-70 factor, ECF subfamily
MRQAFLIDVTDRATETPALPPDVVARIRGGDVRAFESLFRAYYGGLCSFASRYTGERALAEELVQDLFADLWAKRASWEVRGNARSYLFGALRNRALNLRKRQAAERDWEREEGSADVRELHPSPEQADHALEARDLRDRLAAAMGSLPERCRLVMHLRWREQMSYAAIADVMGISIKGVENQLARGLRALRERLG